MSDVPDETLREHVLGWLRASLALAANALDPDDMPVREAISITTENGTARSETRYEPDVGLAVIRIFSSLQALPEVETLTEYLLASSFGESVFVDAGNNRIEDKDGRAHWLTNFYLLPMLLEYIGTDLALEFEAERAATIYEAFEEYLRADNVTYSVVAPLGRCTGDVELIPLDETTRIRRLSDDELSSFAQSGRLGGIPSLHDVFGLRFCVETTQAAPKVVSGPLPGADAKVRAALGALRLTKAGAVGISMVIQERQARYGSAGGRTSTSSGSREVLGPGFSLATDDADEIRSLHSVLQRQQRPTVDLALRRFGNAYERVRHEDRLIDYWIALEALFLPDERQELSYRSSLRVAYLLENDPERRRNAFEALRRSYRARSSVVHGTAVQDAEEMREISTSTEEFLRRSIRVALYDPDAVDPGRLDRRILDGS